jgi:hypothetical protein
MTSMSDRVKELNEKWAKEPVRVSETNMSCAFARAKYYCQKVKESWQTLHKDKTSRILSPNEDQLHQLEKIKIENNCKKLSNLLVNVCYSALGEMTERLEDWYTGAQVAIVQSECLFKELAIFMNDCDELQQSLNQMKEDQKRLWSALLAKTSVSTTPASTPSTPGGLNNGVSNELNANDMTNANFGSSLPPNLIQEIDRLRGAQQRLWSALEENQSVISEFESLSLDQNPNN